MYIQTDDNTANLVELLLQELAKLRHEVSTLSNPVEMAQLFTEDKAAEKLSISKSALINLRNDGKIHYRQIGTSIRYSLADIMEYEESCRRWDWVIRILKKD